MKLLIVDDQIHVLQGLEHGIDWKALGFSQIFTALNAIEARQIMITSPVDVMLCDIEMPFENGLSLIRWVREEKYPTRCILLTAHSAFDYAKDAIQLDVTEYVVQPAPYSDIIRAVKKAQDEFTARNRQQELSRLGAGVHRNQELLAAMALNMFLQSGQKNPYRRILALNKKELPSFNEQVCLASIQFVRWLVPDEWDNDNLGYALSNIIRECFESYSQKVVLTELESREYICMIWGEQGLPDTSLLVRQFEFLRSVFRQYFGCEIAVYLDEPVEADQMPDALANLREMHRDNLTHQSMVQEFRPSAEQGYQNYTFLRRFKDFEMLLAQGYSDAVYEQADRYLVECVNNGQLTRDVLRHLYQDMMQILYNAAESTGINPKQLFEDAQSFELSRNASNSLEEMRLFLDYVCRQYKKEEDRTDTRKIVEQAIEYIERNLEKELRRDEIADHVHISSSYLSRIFRKETGVSLKEYIITQKMRMAQSILRSTTLPVSLVAAKVGYHNFSQFSQIYKGVIGCSPSAERKTEEIDQKEMLQ